MTSHRVPCDVPHELNHILNHLILIMSSELEVIGKYQRAFGLFHELFFPILALVHPAAQFASLSQVI